MADSCQQSVIQEKKVLVILVKTTVVGKEGVALLYMKHSQWWKVG